MEKSFLRRPLCLAAAQKITHAAHSLPRSGELHVKAGYVSTLVRGSPVSRGTLPPCKQALILKGTLCSVMKGNVK